MLVKDVEPIGNACVNLLSKDGVMDIIDEIVELPLRNACRIFNQKGIETVMSSANKNNIVKSGEKVIEKEDVYGRIDHLFETHTFLEAGIGYAWIMLNFDSLSSENKDLVFQLENDLGSKAVWFVHPAEMTGNIEFSLRIGKFNYDILRQSLDEEEIPKGIEIDEKLIEFEKRHIVLLYPWMGSSTEAIFLRMPISDQTTIDEVNDYFSSLADCFCNQVAERKSNIYN